MTSARVFKIDLYEEHLDEASFLYEQRASLLAGQHAAWSGLAELEARLEAHVDALVVGSDLATQVCRDRIEEGDVGDWFTIAAVACRRENAKLLAELLHRLEDSGARKMSALADGIKLNLPPAWSSHVEQALHRAEPRALPLFATIAAYRRLPVAAALEAALWAHPEAALPLTHALGRIADPASQRVLEAQLAHPDPEVRSSALLALLRLGGNAAAHSSYLRAYQEDWPRLGLALAGRHSAREVLEAVTRSPEATQDGLLALGLLGSVSSLPLLEANLEQAAFAASAAAALNCITGAQLLDEVVIAAPADDDEEEAVEAWRKPKWGRKSASPPVGGETVRQLSVDPITWRNWLAKHEGAFDPKHRYRRGQLHEPRMLLGYLVDPTSRGRLRALFAEELVIRFGCRIPLEMDMPVLSQRVALAEIGAWIEQNAARFRPGAWASGDRE